MHCQALWFVVTAPLQQYRTVLWSYAANSKYMYTYMHVSHFHCKDINAYKSGAAGKDEKYKTAVLPYTYM